MELETVNIEEGMPLVEQAIKRLTFHIHNKKRSGVAVLKVIHGFGSSGTGGRIRIKSREYLESLKRKGTIRDYVPGERFSIFDADSRRLLDACNSLRQDRDLERHNNGITLILL